MIFIRIPITHCASQQTEKGWFFADFQVKLKASISTFQASCEGNDLKADRIGGVPALSLTDRLLAFDSYRTADLLAKKLCPATFDGSHIRHWLE